MGDDSDYSSDFLADIERGLGLPAWFILALTKEDDWSLLIKTHALLETAVTEVLLAFLQHEEVNTTVSKLSLNIRVRLLVDFGLIDRRTQAFITRLSGIRNRLVHDIRNVNQSLRDHVAGLQREGLLELWLYRGEGSEGQDVVEGARRNPKILILFSAVGLLNVPTSPRFE